MKRFFSKLWEGWKELAQYFADFQSRWLLTTFYFTILLPFGFIASLFMDALHTRRAPQGSAWVQREPHPADLESAKRLF